jgi:hypothetical protein
VQQPLWQALWQPLNYLESKVPEKNPKTVDPRIAKTERANEAGDRARAEAIANNASPRRS